MRNLFCLVALLALSTVVAPAQTGESGQPAPDNIAGDFLFHQLLDAQAAKNYDAFVAHGTLELKAALTKTQFEASSDLMNARMKGGCDIRLLGVLNQKGLQVYLYRLRFKDGGDDMLGTMALKSGQVAGIYFH